MIFVGLQASGKTTFYGERFAATHEHISKDNFPHARDRQARQLRLVTAALAAGRSVVVDNTNPSAEDRAPIVAAAREAGATVIGFFFDVPVGLALARNRRREGRARVPDVALFTTAKKLRPPSLAEGFDRLWRVRFDDDGQMNVEAYG